jgi:hypothetical protein
MLDQKKVKSSEYITYVFPVTTPEYEELEQQLGLLCYKAANILKRKNFANNFNEEVEDIVQQLRMAMMKAASYYKRQTYIEQSFQVLWLHVHDKFIRKLVLSLRKLWKDRTRHGANRQKFGLLQELLLQRLVKKYVPIRARPHKDAALVFDPKFKIYCKQIIWNHCKAIGKKITKEKGIRQGMVSLSEFDYLAEVY